MLNLGDKVIYVDTPPLSVPPADTIRGEVVRVYEFASKVIIHWDNDRVITYTNDVIEKLLKENTIRMDIETIRDIKLKMLLE